MPKKKPQPKTFTLPPEVKDLPAAIRGAELTRKQKRKDEARRDKMLSDFNSAARQSPAEERLGHAMAAAENYQREIVRLQERLSGRLAKGERPVLINALRVTAENLAEALFEQGLYSDACVVLRAHSPKHHRFDYFVEVIDAIYRPDSEHCGHPATDKYIERQFYVRERARFVDGIRCQCGHLNISEAMPKDFAAMQEAKAMAGTNATDAQVMAIAERLVNG